MNNKLYVGNLAYSVRDNDLEQAFSEFGNVVSAKVMMERDSGRSKGFGFVEMSSDAEAQAAIEGLHEQPLGGRKSVLPASAAASVATTAAAVSAAAVKAASVAVSAVAAIVTKHSDFAVFPGRAAC
ncbi:RNA recognition motif domain-containing protein [Comamonas kerstersii]|uniref:RNA recognition motif domain-containing protein n=1 Tax=Comamonas kerstersii TaxID=225992 RepID=UPI003463B912